MATYPRDRFDDLPRGLSRVGAHRAPLPRGRGFAVFAWAALATGVLVGVGVFWLGRIDAQYASAATTASAPAAITPTVDAKLSVAILNGTSTSGLAASAETALKKDGWTVALASNASSSTVKTTTVYYALAGEAGAAAGLAKSLGVTSAQESQQFASSGTSRMTVVLGSDYAAKH
jgi:hypothetical protein